MAAALWLGLVLAQEPAPQPKPEALEWTSGYDGGFFISGDNVKLTMEGLLQVNALFFPGGSAHDSEFALRRLRLEFSGEFYERWLFHIEPKFTFDGVELEEAWLGAQLDVHRFIFGRMKEPFSFEEMASQRHMDMINFSIMNQFVPAEDHGITVLGSFDILEYGLGFYNGTGSDDTNGDKDAALRLVLHPWEGLQFGGAVTYGRQDTDIGGAELRTEARVAWGEFVPGAELEGDRWRFGAEAAFLQGPFAASAELIHVRQTISGTETAMTGGYVQASYVLTGEAKAWKGDPVRIWKGVTPERPFLKDPDIGAWQLVARWSRLSLEDDLAPLLTNFPSTIDTYTIGVNWYANEFVKVKLNYLKTVYEDSIIVGGDRHGSEDAVLLQFQVMF
jgi:phosphate-selective porin OprO/OprP